MNIINGKVASVILAASIVVVGLVNEQRQVYNSVVESKFNASWYDNNWLLSPYVMWKLRNEPYDDYWSINGAGNHWKVRDIKHRGAVFWTVLDNPR